MIAEKRSVPDAPVSARELKTWYVRPDRTIEEVESGGLVQCNDQGMHYRLFLGVDHAYEWLETGDDSLVVHETDAPGGYEFVGVVSRLSALLREDFADVPGLGDDLSRWPAAVRERGDCCVTVDVLGIEGQSWREFKNGLRRAFRLEERATLRLPQKISVKNLNPPKEEIDEGFLPY